MKPHLASSARVVEHIIATLATHNVKVVAHTKVSGGELRSRKVIETQYAATMTLASVTDPHDMVLSLAEEKAFRSAFETQPWEAALHSGRTFNEAQACAHLGTTPAVLYEMWEQATAKVRLRKGFYVAKLDRNCTADAFMKKRLLNPIFVVNGFYRALESHYTDTTTTTDCFICEWNEAELSWRNFLHDVIGDADPALAALNSVRGSIYAQWEALGLPGPPTVTHNCVHTSSSAFEGLAERLRWKKGSMLFTDLFGSRLLSVRLKSAEITDWAKNPVIDGKPLFEHLYALNSADCISYLQKLSSNGSGDKK